MRASANAARRPETIKRGSMTGVMRLAMQFMRINRLLYSFPARDLLTPRNQIQMGMMPFPPSKGIAWVGGRCAEAETDRLTPDASKIRTLSTAV